MALGVSQSSRVLLQTQHRVTLRDAGARRSADRGGCDHVSVYAAAAERRRQIQCLVGWLLHLASWSLGRAFEGNRQRREFRNTYQQFAQLDWHPHEVGTLSRAQLDA